jgi:hypothetical protein
MLDFSTAIAEAGMVTPSCSTAAAKETLNEGFSSSCVTAVAAALLPLVTVTDSTVPSERRQSPADVDAAGSAADTATWMVSNPRPKSATRPRWKAACFAALKVATVSFARLTLTVVCTIVDSKAHTRFDLGPGAVTSQSSGPQTVIALHTRSDTTVGAMLSYSVDVAHTRRYWQLRSLLADGAKSSYCAPVHSVSIAHCRSDVGDGARVCH